MSRNRKLLLGALTLWPPIYMVLFFASIVVLFATNDDGNGAGPPFAVLFAAHAATILLMFGLLAVYLTHLMRSSFVPHDQRIVWVLMLIFANMIAMPIYWWLYVWKEGESDRRAYAWPPQPY